MLKAYCISHQNEWDTYLQQVMMAYRSSPQSSTKVTPNKMVFGREVVLPMQAMVGRPRMEEKLKDCDQYVEDLQERMSHCHDIARENLRSASKYQKKHYDSNSKKVKYTVGQDVWLHDPTRKVGVSTKLTNKWKGPYLVTKVIDELVCLVKRTPKGKPKAYHVDRLYPYSGRKVLRWTNC